MLFSPGRGAPDGGPPQPVGLPPASSVLAQHDQAGCAAGGGGDVMVAALWGSWTLDVLVTMLAVEVGVAPPQVDFVQSGASSAAEAYGRSLGPRPLEVLFAAVWVWFVKEDWLTLADVLQWLVTRMLR